MKLVGVGGNAPPPWTSKDQALLLCKTPRLKLGVDVGFSPTISWGFGEFLVRTNARREPIVNWGRT